MVSYLPIAVIERVEIEIKGVGDSSRLLRDDNSGRCGADIVYRLANERGKEWAVMGKDVVDRGKINVVRESR